MKFQEKIGQSEYKPMTVRKTIGEIVQEYVAAKNAIPVELEALKDHMAHFELSCTVEGVFGESVLKQSIPHESNCEKALLKSAWRYAFARYRIDEMCSAKDKSAWDLFFENPIEFTVENLQEKMGEYVLDPAYHILRGLAEVFTSLDPAYKSHEKVKIGVEGLPKRIIISGFNRYGHRDYGSNRVSDVINAIRIYQGLPKLEYWEKEIFFELQKLDISHIDLMDPGKKYVSGDICLNEDGKIIKWCGYKGNTNIVRVCRSSKDFNGQHWVILSSPIEGVSLKVHKNGNGHLSFDKNTLKIVNRALAEFYGDILADSTEAQQEQKKKASTAVSKDLAYYPTPPEAARIAIDEIPLDKIKRVLEPSCGDGNLMQAVMGKNPRAHIVGIERHYPYAEIAKKRGFNVLVRNFLEVTPTEDFDLVIMNPPFCGRHYQKHIEHAKKFLAPDGLLVAILPASAFYDHDFIEGKKDGWNKHWRDLPIGSFRESGTNVNTGIYKYWR